MTVVRLSYDFVESYDWHGSAARSAKAATPLGTKGEVSRRRLHCDADRGAAYNNVALAPGSTCSASFGARLPNRDLQLPLSLLPAHARVSGAADAQPQPQTRRIYGVVAYELANRIAAW